MPSAPPPSPHKPAQNDELARLAGWIDLRERIDRCIERSDNIEVLVDDVMDTLSDFTLLELAPDIGVFLVSDDAPGTFSLGTIRGKASRSAVAERAQACNDAIFRDDDTEDTDSVDRLDGHYVLPLTAGTEPIGALSLVVQTPGGWAAQWMPLLEVIGRQIGFAINRMRVEEAQDKVQRDLRTAKTRAERADKLKSDFLANMSHELRTPLNAILGYADLLEDQFDTLDRPDLLDDVSRIRSSGRHLLALINSVLDLSKVEAGRMHLDISTFPILRVCRDVSDTMHPLLRANQNRFELDIHDEMGTMTGDEVKVRQILINLLGNATKFTKGGDIRLRVRKLGSQIAFSVRDSGIGMNAEQVQRVFTAFEQADTSTTRRFGGTGLGLSVSKRYADIMGGSLSVSSRPGVGSTFVLRVPLEIVEDVA